jgi:sec-independent protein translocase protein TatA
MFCFLIIFVAIKHATNMTNTVILMLGTGEIILIALVLLLIFGGKKIPELFKGIGKGINQFKRGMKEDDEAPTDINNKP